MCDNDAQRRQTMTSHDDVWRHRTTYDEKSDTMKKRCTMQIIIIDNRGLNARWCLTPFLLSLPTAAYLGQRGL